MKKLIYTLLIIIALTNNSFSAGTASDSSDGSSNYTKAKNLIKAAKNNSLRIACEIFADRNYEDNGNLISRSKPNALITDPELAKKHVLSMVKNQAINCLSGKQIPCEIDSVCIHGDNESSLATAKSIRDNLVDNGLVLKPLNKMDKFN